MEIDLPDYRVSVRSAWTTCETLKMGREQDLSKVLAKTLSLIFSPGNRQGEVVFAVFYARQISLLPVYSLIFVVFISYWKKAVFSIILV